MSDKKKLVKCYYLRVFDPPRLAPRLLDNGEFPVSIGAYVTIPKAPWGKPLDCTSSKYLDIVHVDITFGDCMSVGGYKYALIFVDRATRFN